MYRITRLFAFTFALLNENDEVIRTDDEPEFLESIAWDLGAKVVSHEY